MDLLHITILRHGESQGNIMRIIQGKTDYPLSEKGMEQARLLASQWKAECAFFDLILSSPLIRASQTAQIVAEALGAPVEYDPMWAERDFGRLENVPLKATEIPGLRDEFYRRPYVPIGEIGESLMDVYVRASQAVQNFTRRSGGRYLVVSHAAFINMVLYAILGLNPQASIAGPRFRLGNVARITLTYDPEQPVWSLISLDNPNYIPLAGEEGANSRDSMRDDHCNE